GLASGHGADDVVLPGQGDEDVLDLVVETEAVHGAHLRAHHLGVAGGGDLQVHRLGTAEHAERHARVVVDDRGADRAVDHHHVLECQIHVAHVCSFHSTFVDCLCLGPFDSAVR